MDKEKQLDDFFGLKNDSSESDKDNGIKETLIKRLSKKSKIRLIPRVLSKKERYFVIVSALIIIGSIISIPFTTYFHFTKAVADEGGTLIEGIVGVPRHINPVLAQTNDADRDLVKLIYSGILKYNEEGKLVPDLAKSYEISSDGLNYTVYLRDDIKWHDNTKFTSEDVVFTIETIQNPDYGSPQRINWQGVEIEKIDNNAVMFKLKNKYAQFLNNLTLNIIPAHLWQEVRPINFGLTELNLKPIGTGPFKFNKLQKDQTGQIVSYELGVNKNFYSQKPFIEKILIKFYPNEETMIDAYNKNEVDNLSSISAKGLASLKFKQRLDIKKIPMPRYFGLFFNQNQSKFLSDKNIRLALSHGTNKNAVLKEVLDDNGLIVNSPMLGGVLDFDQNITKYDFDVQKAKDILKNIGWEEKNEDGILVKKSEKLSLKLTTSAWPELAQVAQIIKDQWKEIGVELNIEVMSTPDLQQVIKDRNYQILLFGEILNTDPDPFSLWHSSQKRDPGLNLALYDNKSADTLLEEARQTLSPIERIQKYNDFQRILIEDNPAIFIYSPYYLYAQSKDIKGFSSKIISMPADRFQGMENWYIQTQRVRR